MLDWIRDHEDLLYWLGILSVVSLVASLILTPMLIARLPVDYFAHRHRHPLLREKRSPLRLLGVVIKNLIGGLLVLAGILMLALPGQGVLTIVIGMTIMNFPGKYRVERWLVGKATVLRTLNWIRRRMGKPALQVSSETRG